jgi:hypothetical protein
LKLVIGWLPIIPERNFPGRFLEFELAALVAPILAEHGAMQAGILIIPEALRQALNSPECRQGHCDNN